MTQTHMLRETEEAADAIRRLLAREQAALDKAAALLCGAAGPLTTAARGSSDHAATAFKYLCEILIGRPVASIGPSVASIYGRPLHLDGGLHITVSQSGASPDIVALQAAAATGGAQTLAIVNQPDSPLARAADLVLPIHAGVEHSVAATKTYLASCAALFAIVARAADDARLTNALAALPDALDRFETGAEAPLVDLLARAGSLYVAGRGLSYGVALEAALKAKETAGIHAEAYSAAELMHGPLQLVGPGFPVVIFIADDESAAATLEGVDRLRRLGADVATVSTLDLSATAVRTPATGHPATDALVFAAVWYRAIEAAARLRGHDPDRPVNLRKVTETV